MRNSKSRSVYENLFYLMTEHQKHIDYCIKEDVICWIDWANK